MTIAVTATAVSLRLRLHYKATRAANVMCKNQTMNKPNLFTYATSELSQDAFICWLLSWASPEYKDSDVELYECAIRLIKVFFEKHKLSAPKKIEQIEVRKQDNNIDVLCIINFKYPIIIEDKTRTKHHSNQLARYLENIKGRNYEDKDIIPIYFKTEDQASYSDVIKNGYQPFSRADFLSVLSFYKGKNSILIDYRNYLQSITDNINSYKMIELSKWGWYSWIGFYLELQKRLGDGCWDYVANPNGGFLGFWWHFQGNSECEQYLQLEQDKFCFKVWVKKESQRKHLRSKWHKIISNKAGDTQLNLVRPIRFGYGEYMTVCVFDGEYRKTTDGIIDMDATIAQFRKAEELLKSVHEITY